VWCSNSSQQVWCSNSSQQVWCSNSSQQVWCSNSSQQARMLDVPHSRACAALHQQWSTSAAFVPAAHAAAVQLVCHHNGVGSQHFGLGSSWQGCAHAYPPVPKVEHFYMVSIRLYKAIPLYVCVVLKLAVTCRSGFTWSGFTWPNGIGVWEDVGAHAHDSMQGDTTGTTSILPGFRTT